MNSELYPPCSPKPSRLAVRPLRAAEFFWQWRNPPQIIRGRTVIRKALADARAAGKDDLSQTEEAVGAVLKVRPDMTASVALRAVDLVATRVARLSGADRW